jgi:sugar lactone lactonase YvrE
LLVVAETFGARLTAFDVAADGTLSNRRPWANLGMRAPDGICMDTSGAIWAACAVRSETGVSGEFVRVAEGGEILDVIEAAPGRLAITCTFGGDNLDTLYCATVETDTERLLQGEAKAAVEFAVVDTPGFSAR